MKERERMEIEMQPERSVRIPESAIKEMHEMYDTIFAKVAEQVLFKNGYIVGKRIVKLIGKSATVASGDERMATMPSNEDVARRKKEFFSAVEKILKDENWVKKIEFREEEIVVYGSIEISENPKISCYLLRGILARIFEAYIGERIICKEVQCESINKQKCVFKIFDFTGKPIKW